MMNSIKTSLPIALHARNSPRWVHSVIENVRRKGVGSVGLYPFIQALESVTEKRTAIPCENLVTDQIRKDCWIEKLSKFLGESVRSRNCSSFFCYGFSAKDTRYRPTDPTPLRRALLNHKIYSSKFPFHKELIGFIYSVCYNKYKKGHGKFNLGRRKMKKPPSPYWQVWEKRVKSYSYTLTI